MDSLEKRAYDIYARNLTVPRKKRLIQKIRKSIDDEYMEWCKMMIQFFKDNNIDTDKFTVWSEFEGYTVSRTKAVIKYDDGYYCKAFYTVNGEIGTTDWDDMGCPSSRVIDVDDITEWCSKTKIKDLEKVVRIFFATHPDLK